MQVFQDLILALAIANFTKYAVGIIARTRSAQSSELNLNKKLCVLVQICESKEKQRDEKCRPWLEPVQAMAGIFHPFVSLLSL